MGIKYQYRDDDNDSHLSKSCLPSVLVRKRSTPRTSPVPASSFVSNNWNVHESPTISRTTPRPLAQESTPSTCQETLSDSESYLPPTARWAGLSRRAEFPPVVDHSNVKDFNLLLTPPTPTHKNSRPRTHHEQSVRPKVHSDMRAMESAGQLGNALTLKPRMRSFPVIPESPVGAVAQYAEVSNTIPKKVSRLNSPQSVQLSTALSGKDCESPVSHPPFPDRRSVTSVVSPSLPIESGKDMVHPRFSVPLMLASPQPPAHPRLPDQKAASPGMRPLRQLRSPKKTDFEDLSSYISSSESSDSNGSTEHCHASSDQDFSIMESADALNCLAVDHIANGDFDNALSIYEHILQIQQERFGEIHPSIAGTYHNLGIVHAKRACTTTNDSADSQHHRARALSCFQSAARVARDSLGPSHPNVAGAFIGCT